METIIEELMAWFLANKYHLDRDAILRKNNYRYICTEKNIVKVDINNFASQGIAFNNDFDFRSACKLLQAIETLRLL